MQDERNPNPQPEKQSRKRILTWVVGACAAVAVAVVLFYVLTTPPTPAGAAEQYIADHYDAVAEAVMHAIFPDSPLKAEIIAEVAESIAEQVIPYNCQTISETGTAVDARCNLSFSISRPVELQVEAPFRVSMSTTNQDLFGRTTPVVQDSSPIVTEMAVNGVSLDKFKEAEAKVQEAKEILDNVGSEIEDAKETLQNVGSGVEEAKDTMGEVGSDVKNLLGR